MTLQPKPPRPGISVGTAFAGVFSYFTINFILGFVAVMATTNSPVGIIVVAVFLVLMAFGGGAAMLYSYNSNARGFGLGLMIGWALTSLFTVGICTGLNPMLYQ